MFTMKKPLIKSIRHRLSKSQISISLSNFFAIVAVWYFAITLTRIFEAILLQICHQKLQLLFRFEVLGLFYDYILVFLSSIVFFIPFYFTQQRNRRVAHTLSLAIILPWIVFSLLLIQYYMFGLVPLDNAILNYSIKDIWHIIAASVEINFGFIAGIITVLGLIISIILLHRKLPNKIASIIGATSFLFSAGLLLYRGEITPPPSHFSTGIQYNTAINKTVYFLSKLSNGSTNNEYDTTVSLFDIRTIQKNYPESKFINDSFPFLRYKDKESTLAPFFTLKQDSTPNIVLIITESLSGVVAGPDATLGSFTPFLDSLAKHSLYWNNCISTSERTINAPSSILGSLPSANGFASLSGDMPFHYSLISILRKIKYQTSFFYGGDLCFDNLHDFINYQKFDTVYGGQFSTQNNVIIWGIDDESLFDKDRTKSQNTKQQAFIKVFLTLSTHGPYIFNNQEKYNRLVEEKIHNTTSTSDFAFSSEIKKNCAALLYTDNAIRQYINHCKQKPNFQNTIFVIVGDHTHSLFASYSDIEKYHVPLIIYSPLLNRHHHSKAIVSHLDIVPSILSLLNKTYNIPRYDTIHWLGQQLDTSSTFKANKKQAFLNIGRQLNDYLSDSIYYSNGRLYTVHNNLQLTPLQNDSISRKIEHELAIYRKVNYYVCHQNRLFPYHLKEKKIWSIGILQDSSVFQKEFIDLPNIKIDQIEGTYKIMLRGEIFVNDTQKCPKFVTQPINAKGTPLFSQVAALKTADWKPLKPNTWQLIQTSHTVTFKNGECTNGTLFSYMWNPAHTKVKYRNFVITFTKKTR